MAEPRHCGHYFLLPRASASRKPLKKPSQDSHTATPIWDVDISNGKSGSCSPGHFCSAASLFHIKPDMHFGLFLGSLKTLLSHTNSGHLLDTYCVPGTGLSVCICHFRTLRGSCNICYTHTGKWRCIATCNSPNATVNYTLIIWYWIFYGCLYLKWMVPLNSRMLDLFLLLKG